MGLTHRPRPGWNPQHDTTKLLHHTPQAVEPRRKAWTTLYVPCIPSDLCLDRSGCSNAPFRGHKHHQVVILYYCTTFLRLNYELMCIISFHFVYSLRCNVSRRVLYYNTHFCRPTMIEFMCSVLMLRLS